MLHAILTNPESSALQNGSCTATYLSSHKLSKQDEQNMLDTAREVKANLYVTFSYRILYMDIPVLAHKQKLRLTSSVQTQSPV